MHNLCTFNFNFRLSIVLKINKMLMMEKQNGRYFLNFMIILIHSQLDPDTTGTVKIQLDADTSTHLMPI